MLEFQLHGLLVLWPMSAWLDPVNFSDVYGARPSMQNMREASELLHAKEEELMHYYMEHIANKRGKK